MSRWVRYGSIAFAVIVIAVIAAVSWHSVQEIHYLKSFFPSSFSVAEAKDAAVIELIKIGLISFPLLLAVGLFLLADR